MPRVPLIARLAQAYGFPRVYRRFLEAQRYAVKDEAARRRNAEYVKSFMRLPNRALDWWRSRRP